MVTLYIGGKSYKDFPGRSLRNVWSAREPPEDLGGGLHCFPSSTLHCLQSPVQGDHSGCAKPPVDIDLKVAFYNKAPILKRKKCQQEVLGKLLGHPVQVNKI